MVVTLTCFYSHFNHLYHLLLCHNILLIERVKNIDERLWYAKQIAVQGWNRDELTQMIKSQSYQRQGNAISNFDDILPETQSYLAQ